MPIYEFECCNCGNQFELLVFGDDKTECPKCKNKSLKRLMSVFSAHGAGKGAASGSGSSCHSCSSHNCGSCNS